MFYAVCCPQVAEGTCVVLIDTGMIAYAGPVVNAPEIVGAAVLFGTVDFEEFQRTVRSKLQ